MPATKAKLLNPAIETEVNLVFEDAAHGKDLTESAKAKREGKSFKDIFGPGSNTRDRYVKDYEEIKRYADSLKSLNQRVVYTLGVWDLVHIGHCRYFEKAKSLGDVLIVGVETDQATKMRKGPYRPVIPFKERVEMLSHIRHIDLIVPICDFDERGLSRLGLPEAIRPDVFVFSDRSLKEVDDSDTWLAEVRKLSGEVVVLDSQAETSTSAKIRGLSIDITQLVKTSMKDAKKALDLAFEEVMERIDESVKKI